MLQAMRTGAHSIIIKLIIFGLLTMATLGLALMDVQGFFRQGLHSNDVARFDGTKITAQEFDRTLRPYLHQRQINADEAWRNGLIHDILMGDVQNRLLTKAAWDAGLNVSDETVSTYIRGILAPLVKQGMTEKEALERVLRSQGTTEPALVNSIRREIGMETLLKAIAVGAHPSREMEHAAWGYRHEKRIGEYFTVSAQDVAKTVVPATDVQLQSYYDATKSNFRLPEYRKIAVVVFGPKDLKDSAMVSEDALKTAYEERKDEFTTEETRMIAQAVLPDEASANKVIDAVHAGKSLAEAAKTIATARYVAPESYDAKSLAPEELSAPAFAAKKGSVTAPIKSPLGWHVLYVGDIKFGGTQSFDAVKEGLRREMMHQASEDQLYKLSEEISDAVAGGLDLKQLAKDFNLSYQVLPPIDSSAKTVNGKPADLAKIPASDKVIKSAFGLSEGVPGNLIEAPSGEFVIAEATEITLEKVRPFAEVKDAVAHAWNKEKTDAALGDLAQKLTQEIEKSGDIAASARTYGKTALAADAISRAEYSTKSTLPKGFVPTLFSIGHEGGVTVLDNPDGTVSIIRLKKIIAADPPSPEKNKEEMAGLKNILKRSLQEDVLEQYKLWLTVKANLEVNDDTLDRLYRPKDVQDPADEDVE